MIRPSLILAALAACLLAAGCAGASRNLDAWRERTIPRDILAEARDSEPAALARRIDEVRASMDLRSSRDLAVAAATAWPGSPDLAWRAARGESDAVLTFHPHEKDQRALAALNSLDHAHRAVELAPDDPEAAAQLAWSLGTTVHLQPMMKRSARAREVREAVDRALALDPSHPVAHATDALLQLRLATLPAPMKLMAGRTPSASLEGAEASARRAVDLLPSVENRLLLAKVLAARHRDGEAAAILRDALAGLDRFPRDAESRDAVRSLLAGLPEVDE